MRNKQNQRVSSVTAAFTRRDIWKFCFNRIVHLKKQDETVKFDLLQLPP
jgi:hypothetical protein